KEYAWVADFTDSQAVIILNNGDPKVYGYKSEGGKIVFDDTWTKSKLLINGIDLTLTKIK
ncbi:hypothetical protein MJI37_35135, partial [Salmonella enterica subsp. enterica serovar Cerro]|nr:hypothetical protein [Salmonella enterica subsp. enterica serovar Cerro]